MGRPSRESPTIAEIAAAVGVSAGTVSKALNGRGSISAKTRARVRTTAEALGFTPAPYRRRDPDRRSFSIAVLTDDGFGRFSMPVMLGAEDALGAGEISVMLCDGRGDPIRERHYLDMLHRRGVDGIIVTSRRSEPRATLSSLTALPVVYTLTSSVDAADLSVVADEAQGGRDAVEHLLETGRTRIAFVAGPRRHRSARTRGEGVLAGLAAHGLEPIGPLWGEWSELWGRQAAVVLLRRDVDGVVCGSDQIARGLCEGLRDAGADVPNDIAVVGFDNWDVVVSASRPPLTSVDLRLSELGSVAAIELLAQIGGQGRRGIVPVTPQLVIRESTAVAR